MESDRAPAIARAYGMDYTFLIMLGLTALTGMLLLIFRATPAMGSLLVLHLALIAALFVYRALWKIRSRSLSVDGARALLR